MALASFEEVVRVSMMETFSRLLGQEVWKAISFYFDTSTLSKDPELFVEVLERLFGGTSRVLEKVMGETLFAKMSINPEGREGYDFRSLLRIARSKFLSSSRSRYPRPNP